MPEDVRDDDQRNAPSTLLKAVTEHYGTVVAGLALVFFGWLAAMYDEFYREFDISAADVGMSYTDTLTRSWGAIILLALSLAFVISAARIYLFVAKYRRWKRGDVTAQRPKLVNPPHPPGRIYVLMIFIVLVIAGLLGDWKMTEYGKSGTAGHSVRPPRFYALVVFDVRAQPVTEIVSVADSTVRVPATGLTYLGNNDRSFVLYCVRDKKILKISMERFTLRTSPGAGAKATGSGSCAREIQEPPITLLPPPSLPPSSRDPSHPANSSHAESNPERRPGGK
jgi:hypothetical protein